MVTQPTARVDVVRDELYGQTIEDPYRWMENWKGEELRGWVEAQAANTREYLAGLPERQALLQRISELGDTMPSLMDLKVTAGRYFYRRRDAGEDVFKLIVRDGVDGKERVVFDPGDIEGDVHTVLDWYEPSRDGMLIAFGMSQGGSEESTLHVIETDTGRMLSESITRTRFGGVSWLEGSRAFVYHRSRKEQAGAPETERYMDSRTYLHRLGDDPETDVPVFGNGINTAIEMDRMDRPVISLPSNSRWMIGLVVRGVLRDMKIYVAPVEAISDPATIPWKKLADFEDRIAYSFSGGEGFAVHGDSIYLMSHKDAPRYKVLVTSLRDADLTSARVVVPESTSVVEDIAVAGDYLLVRDLDAGLGRIRRVPLEGGPIEPVPLPIDGTIAGWAASEDSGDVVLQMSSWIVAPRVYHFNASDPNPRDIGWLPPSPIDMSDIEAREVFAPAHDGTLIPLSIIHRKGIPRDGNNPTILMAYGSYGISINPTYSPSMLAWYERGGVWAIGHIRGGGEYGTEWHEAGKGVNKGNTIDDFIACAEYLVGERYTRPQRLAGMGGSAGGIPTGGSLVKRPDLFAVMVMMVAVTNFLRFENSENGPPNVPEFGSVGTEEGFRGLQIMDSYSRVQDGVAYPACFITTGLNDPRVVVWQATKMAARLQAATSSGKPVLLRVEEQGGHGIGSTRSQIDSERADMMAFLLEQFGITQRQENAAAASR